MARGIEHKASEETRAKVEVLSSFGVPQPEIAKYLGVAEKTLRHHYRQELDTAQITTNMNVARSLYNQAVQGNTTAAIFWLKTRAGWRETLHVDSTSSDGSMTPNTIDPSKLSDTALEELVNARNPEADE